MQLYSTLRYFILKVLGGGREAVMPPRGKKIISPLHACKCSGPYGYPFFIPAGLTWQLCMKILCLNNVIQVRRTLTDGHSIYRAENQINAA